MDLDGQIKELKDQLEQLRKENERLKELCQRDELTGLYNWRCFNERLKQEVARNKRQNHPLCLIFFDVDGLKNFNDTYGHTGGNNVLRAIAESINQSIRKDVDSAYRFGGDEFAIILPEVCSKKAVEIAKRIIKKLSEADFQISLSFGIAELATDMGDEVLFKNADEAMYRAKNNPVNKICLYV